jgi:hypothetical protein
VTHEIVAVLLGFLAGTLSALFGVGGGLIFVPTLIFLGENAHVAVATSLAAMVPVILMGSWRQTRYGNVNWRDAIVIGLASVPTAKLGEVVANSLSSTALQRSFAVLLMVVAVQMAVRALRQTDDEKPVVEISPGKHVDRRGGHGGPKFEVDLIRHHRVQRQRDQVAVAGHHDPRVEMAPAQRRQHLVDSQLGFRGGLSVRERVPEIRPGAVQLFPPAGQSAE